MESVVSTQRKVGPLLGAGIFVLPLIFAWFLLRRGHSTQARVVGFGWLALIGTAAILHGDQSPAPAAVAGQSDATSRADASHHTSPSSPWEYSQDKDEMRGTTTTYASVTSDNQLDFDFPYNGGSQGKITLRRDPRNGLNVILEVTKGQFLCSRFRNTHVSVKFDDGPVESYPCAEPSDGRTGEIFFEGEKRFLQHLRSSSHITIEAEFFQAGRQQLNFPTAGLKWE